MSGERAEMFACKHVNLVKSSPVSKPLDNWTPTDFDNGNYEACEIVQTQMKKVVESLKTASPVIKLTHSKWVRRYYFYQFQVYYFY